MKIESDKQLEDGMKPAGPRAAQLMEQRQQLCNLLFGNIVIYFGLSIAGVLFERTRKNRFQFFLIQLNCGQIGSETLKQNYE
jgi:hypothetical protein